MFSSLNIKKRIQSFKKSPQFDGISKIVLVVSDEIEYNSGDDRGRSLIVNCPWGSQEIADELLNKLKGFRYQPYEASKALVDPAAELGDGITVNGVYSGIYSQDINFGPLMSSDISAPEDEEINHEFKFVNNSQRSISRKLKNFSSKLQIQANKIEAKVEKTGGENSSFGWVLENNQWRISANGSTVLKVSKEGLEVTGRVTANSGKIGGFDIVSDSISYNNATWGGSNTRGIYIGPDGIQLGSKESGFSVDSFGNVSANTGHFRGSVNAGNIEYGGDSGYFSGGGLASHSVSGSSIGYNTISTSNTSGGINSSLGYADFGNGVFNGWNTAGYVSATYGYFSSIVMKRQIYQPVSTSFKDGNGVTITLNYLGRTGYD